MPGDVASDHAGGMEASREALPPAPLVSIVTPSYNQGRFLRRTIESVLGQTYPHIEYHVCDGGSTDESVDVLRSYGDRFAWVSEPDRGQTHAINKGLQQTRGQILAYLNSDDLLLPDTVAKVVRHFQDHPACDLVYGDAHYTDEDDHATGQYDTAPYSWERLLATCCICQPAAFWRRRIAERVGPFDETLHYAMDYEYWLRIDRAGGRIEYLPELLAMSRLHAEAKSLAARRACYQETFRVCLRHGGGVSMEHLRGYWHHLCFENGGSRLWSLPYLRRCWKRLMYPHYLWLNRRRLGRRFLRSCFGILPRQGCLRDNAA
jgi:glycosyltransferase involved in cell wall biosynthesis